MGGWSIRKFRPGKYPYKTLTDIVTSLEQDLTDQIDQEAIEIKHSNQSLKQAVEKFISKNCSQRLLLVADQFEEIYTICESEKECQKFLDELLICVRDAAKFTILFTMRADFLHHALSYRPFVGELQNQKDFKIGLMNQEALKKVIEEPAKQKSIKDKFYPVTLESGLIETILRDVGNKAENLPLLEFTLTQLWKKRTNNLLTHKSYNDEICGVKESIANHAEQIYSKLEDKKRKQLEKIFIQLINPENGIAYTRRVASRTNLGEDNWELITYLNSENVRLVIINYNKKKSQETVEIIHEALIENWSRLHRWMKENHEFRTWQEELRRQIDEWNRLNKNEDILLRGVQLDVARTWYQNYFNDLDKEEICFIIQSWELHQIQIQKNQREKQRFTIVVSVLICLVIGVIGLIILLNKQTILITFIVANKQHLTGKNLKNFYIPKINLSNANLIKINLSNANLDGSNLSNANLKEAKLHYTHAQKAQFQGANFIEANFFKSNLDGSNFSNANLKEAKLNYTYTQKAQFQGANLSGADLSNANLDGSNFSNTNLKEAKLNYTYAQKAQFQGANLSRADLSNANLDEANFSRAKLNGANFSNAYVLNVNFQNADLLQVDFRSVQKLAIEQVKSAQNWDKALYDEDFAKKLDLK